MEFDNSGDRLKGETPLAYRYYELYRDMVPDERSLQVLCDREVTGKKRSIGVLKRWSSQYNWQVRVAMYDAEVARAAYQEKFVQRRSEVSAFIDADMAISLKFQKICEARLEALEAAGEDVDCKELRQLALTYKECREWLKNLIGILAEVSDEESAEED